MSIPQNLKYSKDHEWLAAEDGLATVGITQHAADALGDVIYIQLPQVGDRVEAGQQCGEIESTKSVSDLVAPVSGEIVALNEAIAEDPGAVNTDPYGTGWLFKVHIAEEPGDLLCADEYIAFAG
ncbi:glycine cleavage system protein GcvH [Wenjunlia tyrosinilytica]|jgi:glycine cleavage system H protein|uniref:Glycine cleavage system H protein n=1 Tax=Wenjunlia tyrosinilytica TaxID=1544741 RepID=A0A918E251_9ACTN|nr:glycine cleavage system protein GcvH [Wenjunlia tyrosinilytica]GGO99802.1 glycine cleavage system H protein [Wenjunlia tyrosinilytica]